MSSAGLGSCGWSVCAVAVAVGPVFVAVSTRCIMFVTVISPFSYSLVSVKLSGSGDVLKYIVGCESKSSVMWPCAALIHSSRVTSCILHTSQHVSVRSRNACS